MGFRSIDAESVISLMLPTRQSTRLRQIAQENVSRGDEDEDYDSEEERSRPVTKRGPKPKAPRKVASKWKGKQPEKRRNAGKLSKLPDMPLDILHEVSYRTNSVAEHGLLITIRSAFADILSCLPEGSTADVAS